ncbi:lipocalin-like domain-containing protein [Sphingobacterium sp. NGMCC 1.201703]|uniref:lipocalin-like domain-containing protein n=1 Tax=Sphingobacterium sp. NGMCC 1.201703 TaxID=3388657 RepID=UPI0039FD47A2
MKIAATLILLLCTFAGYSQTAKELIGKWKLVKQTNVNGQVTTPKDTYQVFMEDGKFQGIHNGDSRNGKWKLSEDNKTLTIKVSIISIKFKVESFDDKKRVISSDKTGILEYEKVAE